VPYLTFRKPEERGFKAGNLNYRCQFFCRVHQQYGTGVNEYDDPTECIASLLQVQADHTAAKRGDLPALRQQRGQTGRGV
jgi:hypothetical protein